MNEPDIFMAALQLASAAERRAYLDEACGADQALRQRLEALLEVHARVGNFLESPASGLGDPLTETPASAAVGAVLGPDERLQPIGADDMGTAWLAEQVQGVGPGTCIGPYQLLEPIGAG